MRYVLPFITLGFIVVILFNQLSADDEVKFSSGLIHKHGKGIIEFEKLNKKYMITGEYEGNRTDIVLNNLKDIYFLQDLGKGEYLILITTREGREFRMEKARIYGPGGWVGELWYKFLDPINNRVSEASIRLRDISKISFQKQQGVTKRCSNCNLTFPGDYIYCPYCGARLRWAK